VKEDSFAWIYIPIVYHCCSCAGILRHVARKSVLARKWELTRRLHVASGLYFNNKLGVLSPLHRTNCKRAHLWGRQMTYSQFCMPDSKPWKPRFLELCVGCISLLLIQYDNQSVTSLGRLRAAGVPTAGTFNYYSRKRENSTNMI
jgi:hypothetical protein